jgi:ADP-L-glycero-D-manno-heptose 6-epimerase
MGKTAFITGGTGFIGSHLVERLNLAGYTTIITGTKTEQKPNCSKYLETHLNGIDWTTIKDIDVTFHLAANNDTTDKDRDNMFRANYAAPVDLFYRLAAIGCKTFVYASSCAVYGNAEPPFHEENTVCRPLNPYAESKLAFDQFAIPFGTRKGLNVIGLRFSNVYGLGEGHKGRRASMVHQIWQQIQNNDDVTLFKDGNQKRDWVYVDDAVDALLAAANYSGTGIFNCGSGSSRSFNEIIAALVPCNLPNRWYQSKINYIDNPYADAYQEYTAVDMIRSKELLGFVPKYSLEAGIKKMKYQ